MASPTRVSDVETSVGLARVHLFGVPRGVPRTTVVLGHGAGAGLESWDLQLLADQLPSIGIDVVLVEQPWRVAGKKVANAPARLDAAFREVVSDLRRSGEGLRRLVVGGRSSGARVACRTAAGLQADGVLALAFPLHPPGREEKSRADELQQAASNCEVTVVQGGRDPFGSPLEIAQASQRLGVDALVVAAPQCDHSFKLVRKATITREELGEVLVESVSRAVLRQNGNGQRLLLR